FAQAKQVGGATPTNSGVLRIGTDIVAMMPAAFTLLICGWADCDAQGAFASMQAGARYDQDEAQVVAQTCKQCVVVARGVDIKFGGKRRTDIARCSDLFDLAHDIGANFTQTV